MPRQNLLALILLIIIVLLSTSMLHVATCVDIKVLSFGNSTTDWLPQDGTIIVNTTDYPHPSTFLIDVRASITWNIALTPTLILNTTLNLTNYDGIQFFVKVNKPYLLNYVYLILPSGPPPFKRDNFFKTQVRLHNPGWKRVYIPKEEWRVWHNPKFDSINSMQFHSSFNELVRNESLIVSFSQFVATMKPEGPLISDYDFLDSFNYTIPQLTTVGNLFRENKLEEAKTELCSYYKKYRAATVSANGIASYFGNTGAPYLDGNYSFVNVPYRFPDPLKIDWLYNPTAVPNSPYAYNREWTYGFNRHTFWKELGVSMWYNNGTGNTAKADAYTKLFVSQLRSWTKTQLKPNYPYFLPFTAWRGIESGSRLGGSWPNGFRYFFPVLECADMIRMLKSFYEQCDFLKNWESGGNILTIEKKGLLSASTLVTEFKDSIDWEVDALTVLAAEGVNQFYPDGAQMELSTSYHNLAVDNIMSSFSQSRGLSKITIPERMQLALEYDVKIMTPSRWMPGPLNDAGDNPAYHLPISYGRFFNSSILNWVKSPNLFPEPSFTSIILPYAKYAVLRSSWSSTANYALMDVAPYGGHSHQDKLNVIIEPYGRRRVLYENTGGNYEVSIWRTYGVSSHSHNTVIVDMLSQSRTGKEARPNPEPIFETNSRVDYVSGWYNDTYGNSTYWPVIHQRELVFVRDNENVRPMFLVVDTLKSRDAKKHSFQARWHLRTTNVNQDPILKLVNTTDASMANLAVVALSSETNMFYAIAQTSPYILGFDIPYGDPIPACTVVHEELDKLETVFVTLLIPILPESSHQVKQIKELVPKKKYQVQIDESLQVDIDIDFITNPIGVKERKISIRQTLNGNVTFSESVPSLPPCPTNYDRDLATSTCLPVCFGRIASYPLVCSGHGKCGNECTNCSNKCTCQDSWSGPECNVPSCDSIPATDSRVCSSHGKCTDKNVCQCELGWEGTFCNNQNMAQVSSALDILNPWNMLTWIYYLAFYFLYLCV